jgi:hypothetical protein
MTTSQPNFSGTNPIDKPRYTGGEKLKQVISHALMLVVVNTNPVKIIMSAQEAWMSEPDSCNPEQIQRVRAQNGSNIFEDGCGQYEPMPNIQGEFTKANTKHYNFPIVDSKGKYYGQFEATLYIKPDGTSTVEIINLPNDVQLVLTYDSTDGNSVSITLDSNVRELQIPSNAFYIEYVEGKNNS